MRTSGWVAVAGAAMLLGAKSDPAFAAFGLGALFIALLAALGGQ